MCLTIEKNQSIYNNKLNLTNMKTKVILLEIKDKSLIGLNIVHNHLFIVADMAEIPAQKYQHIYLIDETAEIKEGDWCYYLNRLGGGNLIVQAYKHKDDKRMLYDNGTFNRKIGEGITPLGGECKKIIASTDASLGLPLLSEESIKLLIDYYNKNDKMPESVETTNIAFGTLYGETVDISIPEDRMYTKDEVESLCKKAYSYGFKGGLHEHGEYKKYQHDCNSIDNWIKDNLT